MWSMMIISEKQVMQLIQIATQYANHICNSYTQNQREILLLLETIRNQQSEELKEIK